MMENTSYYELLGVAETAGHDEIKTAFRKLAQAHHPDKNNNSEESRARFILIHNAYSVLSDPEKRLEYDGYLRTSPALKTKRQSEAGKGRAAKSVLPEIAGTPFKTLEMVFSQLNFLLWEIEDFIRVNRTADWKRLVSGKPLEIYLLMILEFIDKWVLGPAGFPDYFFEARKIDKTEKTYYSDIRGLMNIGSQSWGAFVNIRDYFYNIRKRMDMLLKRARTSDLLKTLPGSEVRVIDCVFESQNFTIHYLTALNQVLSGEIAYIKPYQHSNAIFE